MKKNLLFFLALLITGCSSYTTKIIDEKYYPPIKDNNPMIIYYDYQKLPDSAEYIGTIRANYNPMGLGNFSSRSLLRKLENDIKLHGGNAIKLVKEDNDDRAILRGKVYRIPAFDHKNINLDSLKKYWEGNYKDTLEGIYETDLSNLGEAYSQNGIQYLCLKKDENSYLLIYLTGYEIFNNPYAYIFDLKRIWKSGDVYAYLNKTVNKTMYKTSVFTPNKSLKDDALIKIDEGNLRIYFSKGYDTYRKTYPNSLPYIPYNGSLTGFAINNNRLLTCYHGLKDFDNKIFVKGIGKDPEKRHEAILENYDKVIDIAVIKLIDSTIDLGDNLFYLNDEEKGTADDIFVLGYPMSFLMGDEIKLTNGIVSSKSGFAGDISTYQVTAPVQPGNSGAPVMDKNGNLVGMINSKIQYADNVAYSLKSKHIKEFLNTKGYKNYFNETNKLSGKSLAEQVKLLEKSIYIIELIDKKDSTKVLKIPDTKSKYYYDADDWDD